MGVSLWGGHSTGSKEQRERKTLFSRKPLETKFQRLVFYLVPWVLCLSLQQFMSHLGGNRLANRRASRKGPVLAGTEGMQETPPVGGKKSDT